MVTAARNTDSANVIRRNRDSFNVSHFVVTRVSKVMVPDDAAFSSARCWAI